MICEVSFRLPITEALIGVHQTMLLKTKWGKGPRIQLFLLSLFYHGEDGMSNELDPRMTLDKNTHRERYQCTLTKFV
jgi:hypothetical protein